jgi:hypothetical protein
MGTNGGIAHVQLPSILPKTITQWRIAPDPYRQCLNANMVVRVDTSARRDHRLAPTLIDPNTSPVPSLSCLDRAKVKRLQSSCMWPSSDGWTRHDNSTSGRTACEPSSPPPGSPCRNSAPSCTEHTAAWRFLLLAACLAVGHARSHRALNCFPAHARIRTRLIRTMLLEQHSERLRSQFLVLLDSLNHASRTGESCLDGCEALVDEHDQRLQNGFAHGLAVVCELERHALAGGALRDSE